jgi:hypothetical protein
MTIETEIEAHIAEVEQIYRDIVTGPTSRIEGGSRLWKQFQDAVAAWRAKAVPKRALAIIERVNELTVAGILIKDSTITKLEYEPRQSDTEGHIDFRLLLDAGQTGHAEVKTVQPQADDGDENWEKYEERRERFTPNANFIVKRNGSARSCFSDLSPRGRHFCVTRKSSKKGYMLFKRHRPVRVSAMRFDVHGWSSGQADCFATASSDEAAFAPSGGFVWQGSAGTCGSGQHAV